MNVVGGDLLKQIKDAFEQACPNIPCARARFAEVFGPTNLTQEGVTLQTICDLAYDLGLEPVFHIAPKGKQTPVMGTTGAV